MKYGIGDNVKNIGNTPFNQLGAPGHASVAPESDPKTKATKTEKPTKPNVQGIR
jgi:hypothetical protein